MVSTQEDSRVGRGHKKQLWEQANEQAEKKGNFHTSNTFAFAWFPADDGLFKSRLFFLWYTCQLSRLRQESHACGLKTLISHRSTPAGQFLMPD